jgi:hypothetical protein
MITLLVTTGPARHDSGSGVSSTEILSLLLRVEEVKRLLVSPVFTPLTFHWKVCEFPASTGIAVKVTELPWQMSDVGVDMLTLGSHWPGRLIVAENNKSVSTTIFQLKNIPGKR